MSKRTEWLLFALLLVNVAVWIVALNAPLNNLTAGIVLGAAGAHALHGAYGCDFFDENERG